MTLVSSLIGTALEWYDFYLYGTAAALVFNRLFFPSLSPLMGTLAAFATYGVGFLFRPLGGLVFGYVGDRYGRRPVLVGTLILMGASTTAIGLLPGYAQIGIAAPLLLTLFRLAQGFGAGAEFGSAITLSAERAPSNRRGYYASWSAVGIAIGVLLSAAAFGWASRMPESNFLAFGWRIPFLASIFAVILGLAIRLYVQESPVFEQMKAERDVDRIEHRVADRIPMRAVWRDSRRNFMVAVGARIAENTAGFFFQVWTLSYVTTQLGVDHSVPIQGVLLGSGLGIFTIPLFGALSDRVGRKPVYLGGALLMGLGMFPYFWLLNTRRPALILLAMVVMIAFANYSMFSVQAAYFAELFEARTRVTGISMSREISAIFAGGIAPLLSSALLILSGGRYYSVAVYMIVTAVVTVAALCFGPETVGITLDDGPSST